MHQPPEPLGAHPRQRILDLDGAPEPRHVLGRVRARDPLPPRGLPLSLYLYRLVAVEHSFFSFYRTCLHYISIKHTCNLHTTIVCTLSERVKWCVAPRRAGVWTGGPKVAPPVLF